VIANLARGWARAGAGVTRRARVFLEGEVRHRLAGRATETIEADMAATRAGLAGCEARVRELLQRHDPRPIDGTTTVHVAIARDPRVERALVARGLPRCRDCAVGAEETLAEAAFGEGFDLDGLLSELG
jgi:hypothetical protein